MALVYTFDAEPHRIEESVPVKPVILIFNGQSSTSVLSFAMMKFITTLINPHEANQRQARVFS